jgi:hypothetical protein
MMLAHRGNSNIQYISNVFGALEYFVNYVGKIDEPDAKEVVDSVIRLLSVYATDAEPNLKHVFKAVMNALTRERCVTATQVADFFLSHKVLRYSRTIKAVNPRPKHELRKSLNVTSFGHAVGDAHANPITESKQSNYREAYSAFVTDQLGRHQACNVSFFSFLTSFDETRPSERRKKDTDPPLFSINPYSGVVTNAKSFTTSDASAQFTAHQRANIVHLVPYSPVNLKDEQSCFSLLLLHKPWPNGKEDELMIEGQSAVEAWNIFEQNSEIPFFVQSIVACDIRRQELDIGCPERSEDGDTAEEHHSRPSRDSIAVDYNAGGEEDAMCFESESGEDEPFSIDTDVVSKITPSELPYYLSFISVLNERLTSGEVSVRKLNAHEILLQDADPQQVFHVEGHEVATTLLASMTESLTPDQRRIFDTVTQQILTDDPTPLFAFMSGQGGVGKSEVLKILKLWCDVTFGKTAGDFGSCVVCAPTGMSAFNIKGNTWQKAFKKSAYEKKITAVGDVEQGSVTALRAAFKGVQLIIIDEISLINLEQLWEINVKLKIACDDASRQEMLFGGFHVLLTGDKFQLPPVGGHSMVTPLTHFKPSVHATTVDMKRRFMTDLTHFFELTENIRARKANGVLSPFASALSNLRVGQLNHKDQQLLNGRFCSPEFAMERAHSKAIWIFATNGECKTFNDMCTDRLVDAGNFRIRIVAQHKDKREQTATLEHNARLLNIPLKTKKLVDDVRVPFIDLAIGSRVKMLENLCVRAGIVNGAVGTVVGFRFVGDVPITLKPSISKFGKDASIPNREIPVVLVQFDYDEHNDQERARALANTCMPGIPNVFPVVALKSEVTLTVQGKPFFRWQLPLALSHGRTCHSCQGLTAHNGVVVTVSTRFFNYAYVASSRAKDSQQLFFLPCTEGPNKGTMCFFEDLQHKLHPQRTFIEQFYSELRHKFQP